MTTCHSRHKHGLLELNFSVGFMVDVRKMRLSTRNQLNLLRKLQSNPYRYFHLFSDKPPSEFSQNKSIVNQAVQLIQNPENQWNTAKINGLLFPDRPFSPHIYYQIIRRLSSHTQSLKFLKYLRQHSPELDIKCLSFALQAVIDRASCEIDSPADLYELYKALRELNVPLTSNSATTLLCCFRRGNLVDEALIMFNELRVSAKNTRICNLLIPGLLKSGRIDDALKVLDEMLQRDSGFRPNDVTGRMMFRWLMKMRKGWKKVLTDEEIVELVLKLGEFQVFPDAVWLSQMISILCKNRKTGLALDLLFGLIKQGANVQTSACNALLTLLGRQGKIDGMNEVMAKMKEVDIQPNAITYAIIIKKFCRLRKVDGALEMLEAMNETQVEPDVVIFNTLIDGLCKVGRQEEGFGLIEKMKSHKGCDPNTVTYNSLIDGLCKVGEVDRGLKLFNEMEKDGVVVNEITINTLVDGMCRNGRTSEAAQFLDEMQAKGKKCDAFAYTSLINAYFNVNNIGKAMEYMQQMVKEGCSVDAMVYYNLISGLCQAGKMDDAIIVLSKMREEGFCPDLLCYNVLVSGFCKRNRIDEAYKLVEEMEEAGVKPDCITYNTVISYFGKQGDLRMVHRLVKRMIKNGLAPTVYTHGAIIHACCLKGKMDEAMQVFKNMENPALKVKPNTEIYNILIESLCKNDSAEQALSLLDDMIVKDVKPSTGTFNSIFKVLRKQESLEQAFNLMVRMREQGCNPDYITLEVLTEWLSDAGETERLKNFLEG
ncbi:Pentatricopeptide repeat (PPR) superfamily protein [Euphorbia peplus]|nr:Pentatricopeptide repeat (PPR) superfamily protein [Euphorbia peplus]